MSFTTVNLSVRPEKQVKLCVIDIESTALVERLLNELMKATEAYQIVKNESAVHSHEAGLNTQALVPL